MRRCPLLTHLSTDRPLYNDGAVRQIGENGRGGSEDDADRVNTFDYRGGPSCGVYTVWSLRAVDTVRTYIIVLPSKP